MRNRDILVIAEGPDDAKKMRKILNAYDIYANHNIYEYQTNIYCLYDVLEEETDGDWEQVDIPLLLRSRELNEEKKEMLSKRFTEIVLIFDFDPQHTTYEYYKIKRLFSFFNATEEYGKLYVDYPMIESFRHFIEFPNDMSYKNRTVSEDTLINHKYKELVHQETKDVKVDYRKKGAIDNVIEMNLMKSKYILENAFTRINSYEEYNSLNFEEILRIQAQMYEINRFFYVLCTCIFYVIDFDKALFFRG